MTMPLCLTWWCAMATSSRATASPSHVSPRPGHTANHMCYALTQERALFSGDHVMGWSTSVIAPPDGEMGAYLQSLERLIARNDAILYPTHGSPITDPQN